MTNPLRYCLLITLTSVLSLQAGTFTNSFNSGLPAGTAVYGNAVVLSTGGVDGGCLQLTTNATSQTAGYLISDLDPGGKIGSFTADFQVALGGGTNTPADGFSFNFGSDLPSAAITEEGGGTNLTVSFDTRANTAPDAIGIDVRWKGSTFATYPMTISQLTNYPTYVPVSIQLKTDGTLSVTFNGSPIYTDLALTNFAPMAGRFGLGARVRSPYSEFCRIDNLGIATGPASMPQFLTSTPTGSNIRPDPLIIVQMWDGYTALVNTNSIQMTFNAAPVTPAITKTGLVTTVQYASPILPSGSTNTVVVTFADDSGSPVTLTNQFSFVVITYPALPTNYLATADTSSPGFTQRIFQGGTATVGSIALAENLLGGFLINPATGLPFPNTAQTNADGTWTFVQTNVLNYNIYAPTNASNFTNDRQFPGLPGTNGSLVNFALEALTYLYLTPGAYMFGVNSDDGFRLSSLALQLGVVDAGHAAADTLFAFTVSQAGYYPFRLVYFQGTSTGSLEWFHMTPAGQKILINDTNTPGFIRAYSRATTSLPYFLGSWPGGNSNRPDQPVRIQMQDGVGIKVNTNTIQLRLNGATITPSITQTGGVTTVQYSAIWGSASANTALVWFADNQLTPVSQTNQSTFNVITYATLSSSFALSAGAVDTTKPGFMQKVYQTDRYLPYTIANAETMLAGQLLDPLDNPYPNKAATNTDGSYAFVQSNTINYNIAVPASVGNFTNDASFPGVPGPSGSTNTFALEAITYLYLPAGYYVLGVNSDDGFRLTAALNPHELFPYQVAVYDGTRTAADTTAGFAIAQAGYYPFRVVYFQATNTASLEFFSVALSGQKILVNDTNTPVSVRAYRSANNTRPYVEWAYPYRAGNYFAPAGPIYFTLVDGTPAVQLNTIQLTFNGTLVSPSVTQMNGTNIIVSFDPTAYQQTTNATATVQFVWADASGRYSTNTFSFLFYGSQTLAPLWTLPPGFRPYLTPDSSAGAQEAGLAYNPVTGHLILGAISNSTTLRGFYILDALTGNDLGQLSKTNSSGVNVFAPLPALTYFPGYSVGVADDGAIYAATRKLNASLGYFNIYRWASETSPVALVFSASGSTFGFMLGYDFRVRGAGTNTQIIAGAGNSATLSTNVVLFTTTDGSNFTATTIGPVSGATADLYGGIAFGSNNTFYATAGVALTYASYNPVARTASAIVSYNWDVPSGSPGPLGVDLVNGRVISLAPSTATNVAHTVNLFDLSALASSGMNYPVDTRYVLTTNENPSSSGSVAITPNGAYAFVLDTANGIMAYELSVKAAPSLVARITQILYGNPCTIAGTGPVSHPFALVSSTNVAKTLDQWDREQTNTAGTGAFTFSVTPGAAKTRFFRVITQ